MKTYKIELMTSFVMNVVILLLFCMIPLLILKISALTQQDYIGYGFAGIVILGMLIYLLKVKIAISKDYFKSVTVDKESRTFTFTTKKSENYTIGFDEVEGVYMISGEVLRGLPLGYVNVKTKDERSFSLAITKINDFYVFLPEGLNKNLEEYIFFRTNK